MTAPAAHVDVGAYALGLLEEPDRRAFEAHLSACLPCHEELAALSGVAATLDGIGPIAEAPGGLPEPAPVPELLHRRIRRERRGRAARALAGAAAGLVLLAGALGGGYAVGADKPPARAAAGGGDGTAALLRDGRRVSASDAGTGASGTVAMQGTPWGSRVALQLGKVRGPLECELVAVDGAGRAHTVAGWSVPAKGYGLPGSPQPRLTVQGGAAVKPADISRFEVRTLGPRGRTLLTVPA
ncbi:anti-sigma factor family protein [Actinomadura violacea]|uniref:Zf-HC2 domain-containing protein n=1 Tax=Actinomadura violacea TaxID=2819934 RepID=A0ABS3RKI9_9ACTN|nr:zf-HC2 domain-containing protein [Actinomadura violacea]MBO2457243.1 zf-HC2 domain-containing protein [Actinomadura violacea]